jgi:tetratricopeptide (TPR) repeat protein
MSMNNIGNVYRFIGDPDSARLFFDEAVDIYLTLGDNRGAAQALSNQAALLIDQDMLEQAQAVLDRAEKIKGNATPDVGLLNNRGVLLIKQNAYEQAESVLNQGLKRVSSDEPLQAATLHFALGRLMQATGRYDAARMHFEKALALDREQGFHKGIADDLAALGSLCFQQLQYAAATGYLERSIKIYALIENKAMVEATLKKLEDAAAKAEVDIRVTRLFVERWSAGKILENPCN